eukprot:3141191-Rhodomonas_salina.4
MDRAEHEWANTKAQLGHRCCGLRGKYAMPGTSFPYGVGGGLKARYRPRGWCEGETRAADQSVSAYRRRLRHTIAAYSSSTPDEDAVSSTERRLLGS